MPMVQTVLVYSLHLDTTHMLHKIKHWHNLLISPASLYQMDTHETGTYTMHSDHKSLVWMLNRKLKLPYFPVWAPALKWAPGLEWVPGQMWLFFKYAQKKVSNGLKWAPAYRNFEINERRGAHSGKYGMHYKQSSMTQYHSVSTSHAVKSHTLYKLCM